MCKISFIALYAIKNVFAKYYDFFAQDVRINRQICGKEVDSRILEQSLRFVVWETCKYSFLCSAQMFSSFMKGRTSLQLWDDFGILMLEHKPQEFFGMHKWIYNLGDSPSLS